MLARVAFKVKLPAQVDNLSGWEGGLGPAGFVCKG